MSIFNNLFGTGEKNISKVEYWKKWEYFELLDDLHVAFKSLSESNSDTKEKENFKIALEDKIDDIEFGNQNDLTDIWTWFSPGGQWEVVMGQENKELKARIFERSNRWKKASR
jgi:hypothetical protein